MFPVATLITWGTLFTQNALAAQLCWQGTKCGGPLQAAFSGKWDQYIYAPSSRTVSPVNVLNSDNSQLSTYAGSFNLKGDGSQLIFDFGQEVGGLVTISYSAFGTGKLGLAFSEAKNFTGTNSDSSNGAFHTDGAVYANFTTTLESNYTVPVERLRGGFRYLTLFLESSSATVDANRINVQIYDVSVELAYQPTWQDLRAYQGYFHSSDDLLNKIWYAGAFTLQTNAVPVETGRELVLEGWKNDNNLAKDGEGATVYVDGSKRDRTVWAGDLAIAVPSILTSLGDVEGVKTTLQVLWNVQLQSGELPFAGPPLNFYQSDTYHMATLIGTYDYYLFTKDDHFLASIWGKYKRALSFITAKIDDTGLLDVTGINDWGRLKQGGRNTEANMLLYRVLTTGSRLSAWANDTSPSADWLAKAATLRAAVNSATANWDSSVGAYIDSDTDNSIHPQDGNSLALFFGVAEPSYVSSISQYLTTNWGPYGAVAPELPNNIIGFGQSFEVKGHFVAGQTNRALDLIRTAWGWYLNNPYGTGSTTIEGYLSDGTFGYRSTAGYGNDSSFTSHAHGWSTGPTDALTSYVAGLQISAPGGGTWTIAPQFGDLTNAEAGFITPLGKFQASWTVENGGYRVSWQVPSGTSGTLILPASPNSQPRIQIDGKDIKTEGPYDAATGKVTISGDPGSHTAKVSY